MLLLIQRNLLNTQMTYSYNRFYCSKSFQNYKYPFSHIFQHILRNGPNYLYKLFVSV